MPDKRRGIAIWQLMAGLAVLALAGCASPSINAASPASRTLSTCPSASSFPATSATPEPPVETDPALWSPAATSPAASAASAASTNNAQGLPADAYTKDMVFIDRCSGNVQQGIVVRVTITTLRSSTEDRHYDVAHVAIEGGPHPVTYGPADFHFTTSDGQTYEALTTTLPESSAKALGRGTLVPGDEAQGDVIFDVPNGGGKVTYTSEIGGNSVAWPASS